MPQHGLPIGRGGAGGRWEGKDAESNCSNAFGKHLCMFSCRRFPLSPSPNLCQLHQQASQNDTLAMRKRKRCLHFRPLSLQELSKCSARVWTLTPLCPPPPLTSCTAPSRYQDVCVLCVLPKLTGNPSKDHVNCGSGFPVATHFNDTVGPGCSVCSENQ